LFHRGERGRAVLKPPASAPSGAPIPPPDEDAYIASRSHSIFTVYFETRKFVNPKESEDGTSTGGEMKSELSLGKINFVDLAGIERAVTQHHKVEPSATASLAAKEMHHINLSLNALGNVLSSLTNISKNVAAKAVVITPTGKRAPTSHYGAIPYRDSKLTHYLKECFGGNALTVMIANIHSTEDSYQVTGTTLQYASWAMKGQNRPEKHIIDTLQNKAWLQVDDPELLKLRMAIEQRSKDFNTKRLIMLQPPIVDNLEEIAEVLGGPETATAPNPMEDGKDTKADATASLKDGKDDVKTSSSASVVPFVCPKCSSATETIADLQRQLAEALANAAAKEKQLQAAQQSITDLQKELEVSKNAAAQYKQEFEQEKERREQLLFTLTEDSSKLVVPSKSFRRKASESSTSPAVSTAQAASSPTSSSDGETPASMVHPNPANPNRSSQSSRTNSSASHHSTTSSLSGVFSPVTSLWTENQSPIASSATAAVCTSPTSAKLNTVTNTNNKTQLTTPQVPPPPPSISDLDSDLNVTPERSTDENAAERDKLVMTDSSNTNNTTGVNNSQKARRFGLHDEQQGRGLKIQLELLTKNLSDLRSFIDNRNNMNKNTNNTRISVA